MGKTTDLIVQQLKWLQEQELSVRKQADSLLEQLTMTRGAIQVLEKLLHDIETQSDDTEIEGDV